MLGRRRRWARRVSTAVLIAGAVGGLAFLLTSGRVVPSQRAHIAIEQAISLVVRLSALWLLWASPVVSACLQS